MSPRAPPATTSATSATTTAAATAETQRDIVFSILVFRVCVYVRVLELCLTEAKGKRAFERFSSGSSGIVNNCFSTELQLRQTKSKQRRIRRHHITKEQTKLNIVFQLRRPCGLSFLLFGFPVNIILFVLCVSLFVSFRPFLFFCFTRRCA
jgi:hypothetical protein